MLRQADSDGERQMDTHTNTQSDTRLCTNTHTHTQPVPTLLWLWVKAWLWQFCCGVISDQQSMPRHTYTETHIQPPKHTHTHNPEGSPVTVMYSQSDGSRRCLFLACHHLSEASFTHSLVSLCTLVSSLIHKSSSYLSPLLLHHLLSIYLLYIFLHPLTPSSSEAKHSNHSSFIIGSYIAEVTQTDIPAQWAHTWA